MTWLDRATLAAAVLAAGTIWTTAERWQQAEERAAAAYAQVEKLTDANNQWAAFDKRRVEAIAHWEQQAAVYADRLAEVEEAHRALDGKYTDLLNRHVDQQWHILHLEHVKALSPSWITAAWPLIRCESTYRADVVSLVTIDGVAYEQLGLMQLLWDAAMQQVAHELGYTREDLLRAGHNLHTAAVYAQRTDRGVPFRKWGCK